MKRYTVEQLSRILSCAAVGQLGNEMCIETVVSGRKWPWEMDDASRRRAALFDADTWYRWRRRRPAQVLTRLEELGLA